jgi:hypothetical protein
MFALHRCKPFFHLFSIYIYRLRRIYDDQDTDSASDAWSERLVNVNNETRCLLLKTSGKLKHDNSFIPEYVIYQKYTCPLKNQ